MGDSSSGRASPRPGASDLLVGLVLGLILAVVAIGLGMWALMGGGMMGGPAAGPGDVGLVLAGALLVGAVFVVGRSLRGRAPRAGATPPPPVAPPAAAAAPTPLSVSPSRPDRSPSFDPSSASEVDALTLPLLDRDERLLYLEIKESGRSALQKDLGHRDGFSRSKVTRTLDRLEAKGLVARERDGMTNRVRLTPRGGGGAP